MAVPPPLLLEPWITVDPPLPVLPLERLGGRRDGSRDLLAFLEAVGRAGWVLVLRFRFRLPIARWAGLVPNLLPPALERDRVLPVVPRINACPFTVGRKLVRDREVELIPLRFVVRDWPWAHTEKDMPMSANTSGRTRRQVVSDAYMALGLLLISMYHLLEYAGRPVSYAVLSGGHNSRPWFYATFPGFLVPMVRRGNAGYGHLVGYVSGSERGPVSLHVPGPP